MEIKSEGKTKQAYARTTDSCELRGDNADVNEAIPT